MITTTMDIHCNWTSHGGRLGEQGMHFENWQSSGARLSKRRSAPLLHIDFEKVRVRVRERERERHRAHFDNPVDRGITYPRAGTSERKVRGASRSNTHYAHTRAALCIRIHIHIYAYYFSHLHAAAVSALQQLRIHSYIIIIVCGCVYDDQHDHSFHLRIAFDI